MGVAFQEPDLNRLVERMGDWLPVWDAKFKVAPPGERWADQRFAEFLARWRASNGEKFVKIVEHMRIKPVIDDGE